MTCRSRGTRFALPDYPASTHEPEVEDGTMYDAWRDPRRPNLIPARALELLRLVMLYRDAVGLDVCEQLPENLSFQQMIDTINDHEAMTIQRAASE